MGQRSADRSLMVMSGASGDLLISDTTVHTGNFSAFTTVGTTVINSVSQAPRTGIAVVKADLTGKTLTDGKTIHPGVGDPNSYMFTSIQLTSGAVIATYQDIL
jgi:hypothetical protein